MRFTPARHADLAKAAENNGRSISEEVEARIERLATFTDAMRYRWCETAGHSWDHEPPLKLAPGDVMESGDVVRAVHRFCKWCGAELKIEGRPA